MTAMNNGEIDFRPLQPGGSRQKISIGGFLSRARLNPLDLTRLATGGKNNDLKIWDVNKGEAVFSAKNVKNDKHDLTVPIFITDVHFLNEDSTKLVTSTEYHNVSAT